MGAGVEDETNRAIAPSWREARAGDSEAGRSPHGGRLVAKVVAPEREQRITRVAAGGGGHRKLHDLTAAVEEPCPEDREIGM